MKKKTVKNKTTLSTTSPKTDSTNTAVIVAALEKKADPSIKKLEKLNLTKIKTKDDFNFVSEQLKLIKDCGREAEDEEKKMLKGIKDSIKAIQNFFYPFKNKVNTTAANYQRLLNEFAEAQEEKSKQLQQDFGTKVKTIAVFTKKQEELNLSGGAAQIRNIKQVKIVDKKKIPLEYLIVDESAIKAELVAGRRVPGCELITVKSVAI